jgi:hypothetical protein
MPEDPRTLIAEARKVVADCERYLEEAIELVEALREDRERAFERIAAVEERQRQARKERDSLLRMADAGADVPEWRLDEAREAYFRAGDEAGRLRRRLYIEDIDPEHRKAIARQMAALLRDDSERRLRDIAARSDDPELRSAVAECKEEVARGTRYVVSRFRPPRDLPLHTR